VSRTIPLPRARKRSQKLPRRFSSLSLPSARSLAVGVGLLALAAGLYGVGRETSAFSVRTIEVTGAGRPVRHQVAAAAGTVRGTSLLTLHGAELVRAVEALPSVVTARYDRAFPHTLRIVVVPERPVAVARQGAKAWIVSARGRVVAPVKPQGAAALTRIWIPRTTPVTVGGFLPANHATAVARALALASAFPAHVQMAQLQRDGLRFRLGNGVELRLGAPTDIRLKLAIARRALRRLPTGMAYLDVSVPGRPIAGNTQVSG